MKILVTVDNNWAIGRKGNTFVSIPSVQKSFREETAYKTVVLGRKTLESFPQGQPLANTNTIVFSKDNNYKIKGVITVNGLEQFKEEIKDIDSDDIYIVGGESIFNLLFPYCNEVIVTQIDHEYEADAHFDNLDENEHWQLTYESEEQTYFDLEYYIKIYKKATL